MNNTGILRGKTIFITGGSRGIGFAIAKKLAADGANIAIAARTVQPQYDGDETIYTAAAKIESIGGKCLPCQVDVTNEEQIRSAIAKTVETFGGIDIVINNCSNLNLTNMNETDMEMYELLKYADFAGITHMHKYDTMFQTIPRAVFLISKLCRQYLKKSGHAHILNLSPPINLDPVWLKLHMAYTSFKYSASMYTIGMSEEFKNDGIAVNSLWPTKVIYATGMEHLRGPKARKFCRSAAIMADAAYAILIKPPKTYTGNLKLDEEVLNAEGIFDMEQYKEVKESNVEILPDVFVQKVPDFNVIQ